MRSRKVTKDDIANMRTALFDAILTEATQRFRGWIMSGDVVREDGSIDTGCIALAPLGVMPPPSGPTFPLPLDVALGIMFGMQIARYEIDLERDSGLDPCVAVDIRIALGGDGE